MSTEEEGEEAKSESESSIVLSSLGTAASTGLQIGLPIVTPGLPIGTPIPTAITTGKTKVIDFDDYNIMSSDSYMKMIPTVKSGITAAEFAVKEVALKSVLAIRNCSEFYKESKHKSLPGREDGGTNDDEKDAVKRHLLGISILTLACQNNVTIMSYIEESKDDTNWPNGQMHLIVIEINERYKESGAGISDSHARLEQKKQLRDLSMKNNDDPNKLFEALAAIKLLYAGTKIPLQDIEMKDILFEKLPAEYSTTLNTSEDLWSLKNPGKVFTYRILQKEILKAYKVSHKNVDINSQLEEVVLFTDTGRNEDGGRGGGRGRGGRGQDSGKGGRNEYDRGGRGNSFVRWKCHYCGSDQHFKRDCRKYKDERGELWCNHCNTGGHDDGMCFKLHPDRMAAEGGSRQYSKFKDVTQDTSEATTQEQSNITIDVVLCVIDMNEEDYYVDGEYDSSNKVVEIKINE
jgi:hypothetical protein